MNGPRIKRRKLAAALWALSIVAFPHLVAAQVGPEIPLDAPVFLDAPSGVVSGPRVAFDGDQYLVVWEERSEVGPTGANVVRYSRMDEDGRLLDPPGKQVGQTEAVDFDFEASWTGTEFLIMTRGRDLGLTRVGRDGVARDPSPVPVPLSGRRPRLATSGDVHLIVTEQYRVLPSGERVDDLRALRVGSDLVALDPAPLPIATLDAQSTEPEVGFTGADFVIAWRDRRDGSDVYVNRVALDGAVSHVDGVALASMLDEFGLAPKVLSDSAGVLVVHEVSGGTVRAHRIGPPGTPVGAPVDLYDDLGSPVGLGTNGDRHLLVMRNGFRMTRVLVQSDLTFTTAAAPDREGEVSLFAPHPDGWAGFGYTGRLNLVRYDAEMTTSSGVVTIDRVTNEQAVLAMATDGGTHLLLYSDARDMRSQLLAADGTRLGPSNAIARDAVHASVARGAQGYLAAWGHPGGASFATLTRSGARGGSVEQSLGGGSFGRPSVASNGSEFLVVVETGGTLVCRRLDGAGNELQRYAFGADVRRHASVAFSGDVYLVAWAEHDLLLGRSRLWGSRIASDGTRLDDGFVLADTPEMEDYPWAVATRPGEFLVLWTRKTDSVVVGETNVVQVDSDGGVSSLGPFDPDPALTDRVQHFTAPAAFGGSQTLAFVTDGRFNTDRELALLAFDSSDTPQLPVTFLENEAGERLSESSLTAISSVGGDHFLIAYRRMEWSYPYWTHRVFLREVSLGPALGAACTDDAECAPGVCQDGACCTRACDASPGGCATCREADGGLVDGVCGPRAEGTACRAAAGVCDAPEACDGIRTVCPDDVPLPDMEPCGPDEDPCDGYPACFDGVCAVAPPPTCDDGDACTTDACVPGSGCASTPIPECTSDAGSTGDGGIASDGGALVEDGGGPPPASDAGGETSSEDAGGCSCRMAGNRSGSLGWLGLVLAWLTRQRRAGRRHAPRGQGR